MSECSMCRAMSVLATLLRFNAEAEANHTDRLGVPSIQTTLISPASAINAGMGSTSSSTSPFPAERRHHSPSASSCARGVPFAL